MDKFKAKWANLCPRRAYLGPKQANFGPNWPNLGPILDLRGQILKIWLRNVFPTFKRSIWCEYEVCSSKRSQGLNSLQGYPYCSWTSFELSIWLLTEILLLDSYKRIWGQNFQNWSLTQLTVPLKISPNTKNSWNFNFGYFQEPPCILGGWFWWKWGEMLS